MDTTIIAAILNPKYQKKYTFKNLDKKVEICTQLKIMGYSIPTARQLFYREDFPALKVGKNLKVLKSAFISWCSERRMD